MAGSSDMHGLHTSGDGSKDDRDNSWATKAGKGKGTRRAANQKLKVVGKDKTPSAIIKSAKNLVKKFVFHVDNVKDDPSCVELQAYLEDKGVEVLTCFTAKSWVHFKDDEDSTCHAFRVCINYEDKAKILDGVFWTEGILVREWKFKPKLNDGGP